MDALETVKRQAYGDGLTGKSLPRSIWLADDEFSCVYREAWLEGALAATAPEAQPTPMPSVITAVFRG